MSSYFSNNNYTLTNALAWFISLNHYPKAQPIINLIGSCFKRATAYFTPSPRTDSDIVVALPDNIENLDGALFPLHRQIERQYRDLPWPAQIQKIVLLTDACGGRGDMSTAAKVIALMQKLSPILTFDWVIKGALPEEALPFLNDASNVHARSDSSTSPEETPAQFLLTGPVKLNWGIKYMGNLIRRKIAGPTFGFMEIAEQSPTFSPTDLKNKASWLTTANTLYKKIHPVIFPNRSGNDEGLLQMGLQMGSGLFLDPSRINAPLSLDYCCPSYLPQIQEAELREDILKAMDVFDGRSQPNYNQHSLNFGYAHWATSWGKFIDCVAIHEKNKQVVVVLNQHGAPISNRPSIKEFKEQIFTPERLVFLKQKGYGPIRLKGKGSETVLLQEAQERSFTVIVRPGFTPNDMKQMQLASERLMATGDNSAIESWCSRCKLYLYEDVANLGCKWRFLQQQVDLAHSFSPHLSRLLALFGGDRRLPDPSLNQPLGKQKMAEMEALLNDPDLSDATLQFCHHITSNYSFEAVLESALKRTAWHHCIPELAQIEAEALDENFRAGLAAYVRSGKIKTLHVSNIQQLGLRIQATVQNHLE